MRPSTMTPARTTRPALTTRPARLATAATAVVGVLLLAGCGGDTPQVQEVGAPSSTGTTTSEQPTSEEPTSAAPETSDAPTETTDPGTTDPGTTDPGTTDPGATGTGTDTPGAQVTEPMPLSANMPEAEYPWLVSAPLLDGAEVTIFDQDGVNEFALASGCTFRTYQGYLSMPDVTDDESATQAIHDGLRSQVEETDGAEVLAENLTGQVAYGAVGGPDVELRGLSYSYQDSGETWRMTIYVRGMPGADSRVDLGVACPVGLEAEGEADMAQVLEQTALVAGP